MAVTPRLFSRSLLGLVSGVLAASSVLAEPWMAPGDLALRNDVQLLADSGIIESPVIAWPLSWGDIARQLNEEPGSGALAPAVEFAYERVKRRARWETTTNEVRFGVRGAIAENPRELRTFEGTPREDGEASVGIDWTGRRLALRLEGTYANNPSDGKEWRADGSYFGGVAGNWMFSAGFVDRWWGPGWDGSLIMSTNARPIPALAVGRNNTTPFAARWLRWIGPWDFSFFFGQLEEERDVPNARLFGLRFDFRPLPGLQVALSRTAQWCGDGRPCDLQTFLELLIGRSNLDEGVDPSTESGNQLAGYDLRWAPPLRGRPFAFYTQWIGEDEAGGLPSAFLGLFGVEYAGGLRESNYRLHLEFADTACKFNNTEPQFDCAYNNQFYTTGYRYRGRSIGHSTDNDTEIWALGGLLVEEEGHYWNVLLRWGTLNRAANPDSANTVTPIAQDVVELSVSHERLTDFGIFNIGLGYNRLEDPQTSTANDEVQAFLEWRWLY